jgi:biopolymer transport protein ExbB
VDESLSGYVQAGGVVLWLLLVLAAFALAVAIERTVALSRAGIDVNPFFARVRKALVVNRSPREAIKICEEVRGPVPSTVKAGLLKYGDPRDEVESTLENAALFERGRLDRFLPQLLTVAIVAPLLGLLGTIAGVIGSLDGFAAAGAHDPAPLALAVKDHLVTTAVGLAIAIPTLLVYGWIKSRVGKATRDLETATHMLLETYAEMERGGAPAGGRAGDPPGEVPSR